MTIQDQITRIAKGAVSGAKPEGQIEFEIEELVASLAAKVRQLEQEIQEFQARGGNQAAVGHLQSSASKDEGLSE